MRILARVDFQGKPQDRSNEKKKLFKIDLEIVDLDIALEGGVNGHLFRITAFMWHEGAETDIPQFDRPAFFSWKGEKDRRREDVYRLNFKRFVTNEELEELKMKSKRNGVKCQL